MGKTMLRLSVFILPMIVFSCVKDNSFPMKVIFFEGAAILQTGDEKKPVTVNQVVKDGDVILTGEKAVVTIQLNNVSVVKIKEKTSFEITKIGKGAGNELGDTAFNLKDGRIFAIFNRISTGAVTLIKTPVAVVAVRGTAFSVEAFKEREKAATSLQVVEGKVEISSIAKPELSDTISKGEDVVFGGEDIIKKKSTADPATAEEMGKEFIQLQESVDKINNTPRDYTELKKSIQVSQPEDNQKKAAATAAPAFKTEQEIRNYYKRLERVKLDDGTVLIGAIIFQDSKNVKINTVNGVITVPAGSVVESKMIYK